MEKRTYQDLMRIYQEMYQIDETTKGKLGTHSGDTMRGARVAQGGGRLGTFTPARGIGAKKSIQNDTKADDKRIDKQKSQAKKDRDSANQDKYGISPEERRERARKNKELKAKSGIDSLLKDIRGK